MRWLPLMQEQMPSVSNHGGRQIDGVPSAISQLQEVAARVGHKVPVIFDSGIRGGIDVVGLSLLGQRLLRSDVLFFMASQQVVSGALPVSLST